MDRRIKPRLLRLTKIEAAKLQIESAIWLWFVSGDIVSVQTLAAAAHRILHELALLREASAWPITSAYLPQSPEKKDTEGFDDPVSFFRYAKKDDTYEVSEQWTELNLFDAVIAYGSLAADPSGTALMSTFVVRFGVERQDLFVPDVFSLLERKISQTFNLKRLERLSRMDFLKEFLGFLEPTE